MLWGQDQSHPKHRVEGNSPGVAVTPFLFASSPHMMDSSNSAGGPPWLGPATGGIRPTTSGMGLMTRVTFHACGHVTGWEAALPLLATCLNWVGSFTGAPVWRPLCRATSPRSTTIMSMQGQAGKGENQTHPGQ